MPIPDRHESLWIATAPRKERPPLRGAVEADVCIVGGGIVGVTAAWLLKEAGRSVVLLEAGRLLEGVTGNTTAKVTAQHGALHASLARRFGEERMRLHVAANLEALRTVEGLAGEEARFVRAPNHVYTTDPAKRVELERDAAAAARLGLPASFVTETELPFQVAGAVRVEGQAHFHPTAYLHALARRAEGPRCTLHEGSRVLAVEDGRPCKVTTAEGSVAAGHVLVCTNVPILDKVAYVTRMEVKREYALAVDTDASLQGMYVNDDAPRRSVRPFTGSRRMLVVAGESHPAGEKEASPRHYAALEAFAREVGGGAVRHAWSTQDAYPVDGLPLIGRHSPTAQHVYAATGFRAWGMTQGTVAARLLADLVLGRQTPLAEAYDPFSPLRVLKDLATPGFAKGAATAVRGLVGERLARHPAHSLEPGEGRIEDDGVHKVAVSRDAEGVERQLSAVCTHMGCIVAWNRAEQSWDCPCHGSRFAPDGQVLHGPATRALEARPTRPGP